MKEKGALVAGVTWKAGASLRVSLHAKGCGDEIEFDPTKPRWNAPQVRERESSGAARLASDDGAA